MSTPRNLAREVARAARVPGAARTLLLDLDGTLAPIVPTPEQARVPAETLDALRALARQGWTVAVVSGRPARQVRRLVPLRRIRVFGSHGLEGSWEPGARRGPSRNLQRRLDALERSATRLAAGHPGARVERKPAGLAFHDRGLDGDALRAFRRALAGWLDEQDLGRLERIEGKRVLELRPGGVDKGLVVRALPPGRRRGTDLSLVAIGDDRTDEDMFRALGPRGLAVRVGRSLRGSAARRRLASVRAVREFLTALAETG